MPPPHAPHNCHLVAAREHEAQASRPTPMGDLSQELSRLSHAAAGAAAAAAEAAAAACDRASFDASATVLYPLPAAEPHGLCSVLSPCRGRASGAGAASPSQQQPLQQQQPHQPEPRHGKGAAAPPPAGTSGRARAVLHLHCRHLAGGAARDSLVVTADGHLDPPGLHALARCGAAAAAAAGGGGAVSGPVLLLEDLVLGLGAFGLVSRVTDPATGRQFALKRMLRSEALTVVQHVLEEQQVVRQLHSSPFCVRQLGSFQDEQYLYQLMELCPGGDLEQLLRLNAHKTLAPRANWLAQALAGPRALHVGLPEPAVRFYAAGLLLALHDLHRRCIIYRDIKPGNVLLDERGYPRLADFGMAKCLGSREEGRSSLPCGTIDFMAPEVVRCALHQERRAAAYAATPQQQQLAARGPAGAGAAPDRAPGPTYGLAADWWSFGATLYTLLTGCKTFCTPEAEAAGEDPSAVLSRAVNPRYAIPYPPYLSPACADLLSKLLVRQPRGRLGAGPGGARDVMRHPWFEGLDWDAYREQRVAAPVAPPGLGSAIGAAQGRALAGEFYRRAAHQASRKAAAAAAAAQAAEAAAAAADAGGSGGSEGGSARGGRRQPRPGGWPASGGRWGGAEGSQRGGKQGGGRQPRPAPERPWQAAAERHLQAHF